MKKKEELADTARTKNNRDQQDWGQIQLEKTYNFAVQDKRQSEILSDSDVQRFAEEFSGVASGDAKKMEADLREQMQGIINSEKGQRTAEQQKELDLINKKIDGLNIAANGGIEQAVSNFKKTLEKPIKERI